MRLPDWLSRVAHAKSVNFTIYFYFPRIIVLAEEGGRFSDDSSQEQPQVLGAESIKVDLRGGEGDEEAEDKQDVL